MSDTTVVVIGGGIAGASVAFALRNAASPPDVVLVEAEPQLGQHTTGRSAALFIENYGADPIRPLTRASRSFFHDPPDDLVDAPLLTRRAMVMVADAQQTTAVDEMLSAPAGTVPTLVEISPADACAMVPALRPEPIVRALHEPDAADIDVAALLQAFVRGFHAAGGRVETSSRVDAVEPDGAGWIVHAPGGDLGADVVVDAAGAWGDVVAARAGIEPIGLSPLRRTAFMVASPVGGSADWPTFSDVAHTWYVKPDGSQLLCSPADETPSEPCDARPDEIDVALAIERINAATTLAIRSVRSSWAGLRTFAPDRSMVLGPEPTNPSFVWCVGQGGTGIQTAPAAGQLVADLVLRGEPGPTFDEHRLDLRGLLPDRFRAM